jgi:hypothetical protein
VQAATGIPTMPDVLTVFDDAVTGAGAVAATRRWLELAVMT